MPLNNIRVPASTTPSPDRSWTAPSFLTARVTAVFDDEGLRSLSGTWITAANHNTQSDSTAMGIASALVAFLDGRTVVCREILSLKAGYYLVSSTGSSVRLNPVWQITVDSGEYYLDAVSGEIF